LFVKLNRSAIRPKTFGVDFDLFRNQKKHIATSARLIVQAGFLLRTEAKDQQQPFNRFKQPFMEWLRPFQ